MKNQERKKGIKGRGSHYRRIQIPLIFWTCNNISKVRRLGSGDRMTFTHKLNTTCVLHFVIALKPMTYDTSRLVYLCSVPVGARSSFFSKTPIMLCRSTQPPSEWVGEVIFSEIKRPGHEIDHSTPTSNGDKNKWSYKHTSSTAFMSCRETLLLFIIVDWYLLMFRATLQAGRSRVRFPIESLGFFIDLIFRAALWSWGRLSL
jgi:hypothetical protein